MKNREQEILDMLTTSPEKAMSLMYDEYFQYLLRIVFRVLKNEEESQDIIQAVFIDIWKKKENLQISSSLKQYLRRAAINRSLNLIRASKNKMEDSEGMDQLGNVDKYDHSQLIEAEELKEKIARAIEELPDRCRLVFTLSRFEDMSYKEISEKMDISLKTVENQMSKALKLMRNKIYEKKT